MIARQPIMVRAPVRISFAGGGTDLPSYYERHGGLVLSSAITRYAYVIASPSPTPGIHITSADYGLSLTLDPASEIDLAEPLSLPKAAVQTFLDRGLRERGVRLFLACEVAPGTGLGSSSAMAVALCRALGAYLGLPMSSAGVANLACRLELDRLGMLIGKQDQYAAAFGGLNTITFSSTGVSVTPIAIPSAARRALASRLLLFSTGQTHHSASILREMCQSLKSNPEESLHELKELATLMTSALRKGELDRFGKLLHVGWELKKSLSQSISTARIDQLYAAALDAGALGGKITGAGGGGYLLLSCPPDRQPHVRREMKCWGLAELPFALEHSGAQAMPVHRTARRLGADHSAQDAVRDTPRDRAVLRGALPGT